MEILTYENTGDWLEHLIGVTGTVEPHDDPVTRTLGYKVKGVVHRVRKTTVMMVQETFQTVEQRDKVLAALHLEFGDLRDRLRTPEGRARLYSRAG